MKINDKVILLTGAGSGIGQATAIKLAEDKPKLIIAGRTESKLLETAKICREAGAHVNILIVDLCDLSSLSDFCKKAEACFGHIDILINNAGVLSFTRIENETEEMIERIFKTNVMAPMILCKNLQPHLKSRPEAYIVNTGSIFGSIGFAYHTIYSSSKFALRGFSEALRRELVPSGIKVLYVAPRATKTKLADIFGEMAKAVGMNLDPVEKVADAIVSSIKGDKKDVYLGFPECLFVRINGLLPRFVDGSLKKQNIEMEKFAK